MIKQNCVFGNGLNIRIQEDPKDKCKKITQNTQKQKINIPK